MSHLTATIAVYDVMGDVFMNAVVTDHDLSENCEGRTRTFTELMQGEGVSEHARWLRDAVMYLAESL